MNEDGNGSGCAPVFLGVIVVCMIVAFGVFVAVPSIDSWQAGNARTAEIEAQARATVAQIEAQAQIQVAQEKARRDVLVAQQEAQRDVQLAAMSLAGDAMHGAQNTLYAVLWFVFSLAIATLALLTAALLTVYNESKRRTRTPRWMTQRETGWQPATEHGQAQWPKATVTP